MTQLASTGQERTILVGYKHRQPPASEQPETGPPLVFGPTQHPASRDPHKRLAALAGSLTQTTHPRRGFLRVRGTLAHVCTIGPQYALFQPIPG